MDDYLAYEQVRQGKLKDMTRSEQMTLRQIESVKSVKKASIFSR